MFITDPFITDPFVTDHVDNGPLLNVYCSVVMVKINHNMLIISGNERTYSSNISGRTEENHCMNYL